MRELIYTSVPRGLHGASGYTTVAHTEGMPAHVLHALEGLSTYQHLEKRPDAYASNPSGFSHLITGRGIQRLHLVSRIAACSPDYSGRTNFVAHHLAMTADDVIGYPSGPAMLAMTGEVFREAWSGNPVVLTPRKLPRAEIGARDSVGWSEPDAGWAPYLADRLRKGAKTTYLIYPPDGDLRVVLHQVYLLLSPEERWSTTFATYATTSFPGPAYACQLRGVIAGTDYAASVVSRFKTDCFSLMEKPPAFAVRVSHSRVTIYALFLLFVSASGFSLPTNCDR